MATQQAMFAAGCFWGVEETFRVLDGVVATEVGYAGGQTANPSYEQVCGKRTGHAEVVRIEFDPDRITYEKLLDIFWKAHDPTQVNRQGPDVGSQYRSAIFFFDEQQQRAAEAARDALDAAGHFPRPIATELTPAGPFYRAEEYHQQYLAKRGQGSCRL